jgi:hypothetical protein
MLPSGGWSCHQSTRSHNDCSDRSWFSPYVPLQKNTTSTNYTVVDNFIAVPPGENYLKYVLIHGVYRNMVAYARTSYPKTRTNAENKCYSPTAYVREKRDDGNEYDAGEEMN